uniref:Branched chain amino-acid transaminase 1, cytosolic n=1 Tax=Seriola lalandi dorsalis TaxID=1841481 RepID=A0A3B4WC89_SERLL
RVELNVGDICTLLFSSLLFSSLLFSSLLFSSLLFSSLLFSSLLFSSLLFSSLLFSSLLFSPLLFSSHQLFEGMKAYRGDDNRLRLFRPMLNMNRMANSSKRACLPAFDQSELLECIRRLVEIDEEWVPHSNSASLYIRPTFISTEPSLGVKKPSSALLYVILSQAGSYFNNEAEALSLWADPKYTRAWKGGTGDCKMGGNYGCALFAQYEAVDYGCQQVLWLYGEDHQITEAGTMNIFLHWINEDGGDGRWGCIIVFILAMQLLVIEHVLNEKHLFEHFTNVTS